MEKYYDPNDLGNCGKDITVLRKFPNGGRYVKFTCFAGAPFKPFYTTVDKIDGTWEKYCKELYYLRINGLIK